MLVCHPNIIEGSNVVIVSNCVHKHEFTKSDNFVKRQNSLFIKQCVCVGIVICISNNSNGFLLESKYSCDIRLGGYTKDDWTVSNMTVKEEKVEHS